MARIAILTASDRGAAGERADSSGDIIAVALAGAGHSVVRREIVPDDREQLSAVLAAWCDGRIADVIITTGGTGLGARDVMPEATAAVGERDVPGIPVALALEGLKHTPFAILSRGRAVIRGSTLIVNLPGNPRAVEEGMAVLLPLLDHVARLLAGPFEHDSPADSGHSS